MTVVNNIAALRALSQLTNSFAQTLGYYQPGDQGFGSYRLDAADTSSADNGGTIIVAADGGRWKLLYDSVVSLRQFGAHGDGSTTDTIFVQAAFDAGVPNIFINAGNFMVGSLNFGDNSATRPSNSPQRLFGTGLSSAFTAIPGTATLLNARNVVGIIFEDFSIYCGVHPEGNESVPNCEWLFDSSWTLGPGPSLNNSYTRLWLRGSGIQGNWLADNNNDCLFLKCVIEGSPTTTALQIYASGGAVALDQCVVTQGLIKAWTQNLLVNGGYNFGIEFAGILNSVTINSCYIYASAATGACIATLKSTTIPAFISLISNGGLYITSPGTAVFNCLFSSDSTVLNATYVGAPDCRIFGPDVGSASGNGNPVRVTLNGGTSESGTDIVAQDAPDVYIGLSNVRSGVGFSHVGLLNTPAPTLKGQLSTTVFGGIGAFVPLFPELSLSGDCEGPYLLTVTLRLADNPYIITGSGVLPLIRRIGAAGPTIPLSTLPYMGANPTLSARVSATITVGAFPGIEVQLDGILEVASVDWSIIRM